MLLSAIECIHRQAFNTVQRLAGTWFLGLSARLVFGSVLLFYFANSAATKVGSGFPGILIPGSGAYAQILPPIAEAANYDASKISFIPWGAIVHMGTYAEFLLPVAIVFGLFTRLASLGMIGFIAVMTFVDIQFHGVGAETIGGFFDRIHDSAISDQRLLWVFPLLYLAVHGPGPISIDGFLKRFSTVKD